MSHPKTQPSEGPTGRLERVRRLLKAARENGDLMRTGSTGPIRDAATAAYVTTLDRMVEELAALEDIGALDELARMAAVTWGRA